VGAVSARRPASRLAPTRIRGASEQVAAQIRRHVQREGLGPDDFLGREEDLAAEFGVSRPTLREALKLLASANLIRASKGPGGGIFVSHTPERGMGRSVSDAISMMLETGSVSLRELLDARTLIEVPLAGVAAYQAGPETVARLRAAVAAGREAAAGDFEALAAADAEFHRALAAVAGNRVVEALTDWILEVLQPSLIEEVRAAIVPAALIDQHERMLGAIEKGDAGRAERAMKDHLLYLRDVLAMVRGDDAEAAPTVTQRRRSLP
jgi:GntR family transcriptional regulator, transcriptional repressor for pyruvate dehydrogenase complex